VSGIEQIRIFDTDRRASEKAARNLRAAGLVVTLCDTAQGAIEGAAIITTCTADKQYATVLSDNMVGSGIHINAIGGDCLGKTELAKGILLRSDLCRI
jgi:ornithine cyclodeaminase